MPWKILSCPSSHRATRRRNGGARPRKLDLYIGSAEAGGWTQTFLIQLSHLRQYNFTTYMTADFSSGELINFDYFDGKWYITKIKNEDMRFSFNGQMVHREQLPIQLKRDDELTILANAAEDWVVFFQVIDLPLVSNAPHSKCSQFQLYSGDYQAIMRPIVPPVNEGVPELVPFPYQECLNNPGLLNFLIRGAILPAQLEEVLEEHRNNPDNEGVELDITYGRSLTCIRFRFPYY